MLRPPHGRPVALGPLPPRRDRPIILAVATRLGLQDDLLVRLDQGLAVVPLPDPGGGLPCR
jgi:hypothetical protein